MLLSNHLRRSLTFRPCGLLTSQRQHLLSSSSVCQQFTNVALLVSPAISLTTRFNHQNGAAVADDEQQKSHQANDEPSMMRNGEGGSSTTTPSTANSNEQKLLAKIIRLENELKIRDNIIREFMTNMLDLQQQNGSSSGGGSSASSTSSRNPHNPDCGRFVVSTGNEIADAVMNGANHILLDCDKITNNHIFLPHPICVEGDHVLLVETLPSFQRLRNPAGSAPPDPVKEQVKIIGNWKLGQRVKFHSHDLDFSGDGNDSESLFFLSSGASLVCHKCCLGNAREAVYLSSSTHATLTQCSIHSNVRGIFESFRSICKLIGCDFSENFFHAVLLSKDAQAALVPASSSTSSECDPTQKKIDKQKCRLEQVVVDGNEFHNAPLSKRKRRRKSCVCSSESDEKRIRRTVRGDVVFTYNPMIDTYDDVYHEGSKIVLTDSAATTGLVDSSW